ncbi:MAG: phosphonate C-P lyase system protein PhnH [Chloroflexi bacterium]|nr:phosphonate C-P lyase system protein PhnH [Chloroflexota bacterium]
MTPPPYTRAEAEARETFLALMWALSYPGRVYQLPAHKPNFELIAGSLLDLETSYFTVDAKLQPVLAQTSAQALPVDRAAYHFFPAIGEEHLAALGEACIGTRLYPDEAATLFIGCALGSGLPLTLRGPGINGAQALQVSGVPKPFWHMRQAVCRFPLGWDVYLVDGQQIVGLPRSVQVEFK